MGLKERIQELCRKKGVTAQQAEIDLGFAKGYISKLSTSIPNAAKVQKMAEYFGVPVGYILGEEKAPIQRDERDDEVAELLEFYRSRTDDCRMLFSVAKSATSEDIRAAAALIEALRKKEGR